MTKLKLLILSSVFIGFSANAQQFNIEHLYPIEASHSYVEFVATYMGYAKVRGNFSSFYGSIYYDPDNIGQTSVSFQIDVESIDTNNDWRDRDLKSKNWFLAEDFPHIKFISSKVRKKGKGLQVTGNLTIKETTKTITLDLNPVIGVMEDVRGDDQVIFTGEHTINRKEYGVMGARWDRVKEGIVSLSPNVKIEFSLLAKQINEGNFQNFLRNEKSPPGSIHAAYKKEGIQGAKKQFESLRAQPQAKVNANALNMVAYMLIMQDKLDHAAELLTLNQSSFPDNANVYDSMGELYLRQGKLDQAKAQYQKSLSLDAKNFNAVEVLKHLK